MKSTPISPKRNPRCPRERAGWFQYYAGYSPTFAREVVAGMATEGCKRMLDPWNGAGTTTEVARELALAADGVDANPVMLIVARARLLGSEVNSSLRSLAADFAVHSADWTYDFYDEDPLLHWLHPSSAKALRALELTIRSALTEASSRTLDLTNRLESFSSLAAFYYVALFRTVRALLHPFRTTNPAWITIPRKSARLRTSIRRISECFVETVESMLQVRVAYVAATSKSEPSPGIELHLGDSRSLPLPDNAVDGVLSSPPYCTRLDYAVATRPELAILGASQTKFDQLRRKLIGAATIADAVPEPQPEWGGFCNSFLGRVRKHPSKDSAGYYWKHHLQYFDGLYNSLREIDRVLKPGSPCVLVVQDSHYKELHNDLAQTVTQMTSSLGWTLERKYNYAARAIASINRGVSVYGKRNATESVMWLRSAH